MSRLPIDARPPHIREQDARREDEAIRSLLNERIEAIDIIDSLRRDEGNSITIFCDNPDFGGPNCAIEVCADWTGWDNRRFTGDTLLSALRSAETERRKLTTA